MLDLLHEAFRPFCHQLAARSPQFSGAMFPVCYRCAGFYAGLVASVLFFFSTGRRALPRIRTAVLATIPAAVCYVDGIANLFGWWDSPEWLRAGAGAGVGLLLPMILLPLLPFGQAAGIRSGMADWIVPALIAALLLTGIARPPAPVVFEALAWIPAIGLSLLVAGLAGLAYNRYHV